MPNRRPKSSARLRRAASAETERLEREQARLLSRAQSLSDELRVLQERIQAVDERIEVLRELSRADEVPARAAVEHQAEASGRRLRGPAIREAAVRVLFQRSDGTAPIHYKEWLRLMHQEGFIVDGANEAAVFLSQITRSPLVARTTKAGTYQLDLEAPDQLRRRLARLQAQLRDGSSTAGENPADLAAHRTRRRELDKEIGRTERQLEEALRLMRDLPPQALGGVRSGRP